MKNTLWIIAAVIIGILVFFWILSRSSTNGSAYDKEQINKLVRQMHRWYIASTQDQNAVIKMLHSNYAVAYADALQILATDKEIKQAAGIDIRDANKNFIAEQDKALVQLYQTCPSILPDNPIYKEYISRFLGNTITGPVASGVSRRH